MDEPRETKEAKESSMPGLALMGLILTGVGSLGLSVGAICASEFQPAALGFIGAALAFGAIAKVSFR